MKSVYLLSLFFILISQVLLAQSMTSANVNTKSVDIIGEFGDITVIRDDTEQVTITIETNDTTIYTFELDQNLDEILLISTEDITNTIDITNALSNIKTIDWKNSLSFGTILNKGNSDLLTIKSSLNIERERTDVNEFILKASIDYRWVTNAVSYGKIEASTSYKYVFWETFYLFGRVSTTHNYGADLEYKFLPTAGIGYWLNIDELLELKLEIGAGDELKHYYDVPNNDAAVLHLRGLLEWDINDNLTFDEDLRVFPSVDFESFTLKNDSELSFALNKWLAAQLKYKLSYNSHPAEDKEKMDHSLSFQLKLMFDKTRTLEL